MTLAIDPALSAPPLTLGRLVVLVQDYDAALAFYRAAFGARVLFDAPSPTGDRYLHVGFDSAGGASFARVSDLYGNVLVLVEMSR